MENNAYWVVSLLPHNHKQWPSNCFTKIGIDVMVKDIASGVGRLGFHFRAGEIRQSVASSSPLLQCFFEAVLHM